MSDLISTLMEIDRILISAVVVSKIFARNKKNMGSLNERNRFYN